MAVEFGIKSNAIQFYFAWNNKFNTGMNFIHYINGLTFINPVDRTSTDDRCINCASTAPYGAARILNSLYDRIGIRLIMLCSIPP